MDITNLSAQQLRQAADLKEKIDGLQDQLNEILGGEGPTPAAAEIAQVSKTGRRKVSAEARARMAAAQKARWAAKRGEAAIKTARATVSQGKPKRHISPALRKARSEAMKARWAKARRAGKSRP
jgi:hypothetical protein